EHRARSHARHIELGKLEEAPITIANRAMPTMPPAGPIGLVQFANQDAGFRRWASTNVRGYVLNQPSPDELVLHFGFCLRLHDHHHPLRLSAAAGTVCVLERRDEIQFSFVTPG